MQPSAPALTCRAFALLLGIGSSLLGSGQKVEFNILKGDGVIGRIIAQRNHAGHTTHYLMTSYAEFDIVLKQVVKTSMSADYRNGALVACHSLVRVNNNLKDSSHMVTRGDQRHHYIHPKTLTRPNEQVEWTTARMYFEEPVGQQAIYVESVLTHCPLQRTAAGRYTLTMPNGNLNHYVYRNGVLMEVVVDRSLVDLVFRRL